MKQLNLFGNKRLPVKRHRKRKYSMKHWSYRQRFTHLLSSKSKMLSAKQVKKLYLLDIYVIKHGKLPSLPTNSRPIRRGHTPFKRTVNQSSLNKAVHAMYQRKHKHYPLSINKICKKFHVSKPSLYRGYKAKFTDK